MIPYRFTEEAPGHIRITKTDGNPDTRYVMFTERSNGYGMYTSDYGVDEDSSRLHRLASPVFFEYHDGASGRYSRVAVADIREHVENPDRGVVTPILQEVRHQCWFGESTNEIRRRLNAQRRKRLEQAMAQARQRKADEEERKRREAEEAEKLARVEAEYHAEQGESFEDELARMLAEAGLTEFAE